MISELFGESFGLRRIVGVDPLTAHFVQPDDVGVKRTDRFGKEIEIDLSGHIVSAMLGIEAQNFVLQGVILTFHDRKKYSRKDEKGQSFLIVFSKKSNLTKDRHTSYNEIKDREGELRYAERCRGRGFDGFRHEDASYRLRKGR
jgi:hypothetical protein